MSERTFTNPLNSSALRNFFYNNKFSHNLETINSILQKSLPIINFFLSFPFICLSVFSYYYFPLNLPYPSDRAAHKFCNKSERENVPKWKFNIETCGLCVVLTETIFLRRRFHFSSLLSCSGLRVFFMRSWTCSYFSSSSLSFLIKIYLIFSSYEIQLKELLRC